MQSTFSSKLTGQRECIQLFPHPHERMRALPTHDTQSVNLTVHVLVQVPKVATTHIEKRLVDITCHVTLAAPQTQAAPPGQQMGDPSMQPAQQPAGQFAPPPYYPAIKN